MAWQPGPEGFAAAVALFERLVDLPPPERERLLADVRATDVRLADLVKRMLAADADGAELLTGGLATAARLAFDIEPIVPGARIGGFEVLREIGRGGMGVVYEARDLDLDRVVALKVLGPPSGSSPTDGDALLAEARIASSLDHPNVATIYQVGETGDGRRFIAMARYDGETLRDRLARGGLSATDAFGVSIQAARGLAAIHSAGIVHRDVKPENIFLTSGGPVKLLDFGIARAAGMDDPTRCRGTPRYMSPELRQGGPPDARSDVWALGAVIGEMLDPAEASPLAAALRTLADRATADDPTRRFADGRELIGVLLASRPNRTSRRLLAAGAAIGLVILGFAALVAVRGDGTDHPPILAVADLAGPEAGGLTSLLAQRLAGLEGIEFVPPERLQEVRAQLAAAGHADSADGRAVGLLSGARQLIEGRLARTDAGFDLRLSRVDLPEGRVTQLPPILTDSVSDLVDAALVAVARDIGVAIPTALPAHSGSILAARLYEEGLRAYHAGDRVSAERLLAGALAEDSVHAQALLLMWAIRRPTDGETADTLLARVARIAEDLPRHEALVVRTQWAAATLDPAYLALADTLVRTFPHDPAAHLLRAKALGYDGDHQGAARHLREVLVLDSLSLRGTPVLCRACDALAQLVGVYDVLDSLGVALDMANEWVGWRPDAPAAWRQMGYVLEDLGRDEAALEAHRHAARLAPGLASSAVYPGRAALRAGRWAEADRLLSDVITHGHPEARRLAMWFLAISLREQGRLRQALEVERRRIRLASGSPESEPPPPSLLQGQLLAELGRFDEAAATFEALERRGRALRYPGRRVRERSWPLVQLATALGAAGDTARLGRLVAPLAEVGTAGLFERDRVGHHYARGLQLRLEGRPEAAEGEIRRAITSLTNGYSRVNLELARLLLALGRPEEAIVVLEAALPGMLESVHLYVSRTELREALATAYEAAGRPEEAAQNFRRVASAWEHADPEFEPRAAAARASLERLTEGPP